MDQPHDTSSREKLWELIKDIRFAMFTTHHRNGHLHSRPMTTQNQGVDEDSSLWFLMSGSSETVADLRADPEVNVVYADPDKDSYVSVSGVARMVDNPAKKEQLWNKINEAWFPQGPNDPDVALVQVQITHADYWDVKSSKLVQLITMAKSAFTGRPPRDMTTHGQVRMR
jgi:general stress protein 26